jgi:hypothetical protein
MLKKKRFTIEDCANDIVFELCLLARRKLIIIIIIIIIITIQTSENEMKVIIISPSLFIQRSISAGLYKIEFS